MKIWVPVADWPYYEITPYGDVRSKDRFLTNRKNQRRFYKGKVLKPWFDEYNYLRVQLADDLSKVDQFIHYLVCSTFHGPRPVGSVCRHLDDNTSNNFYENLMWGTQKDNVSDSIRNGRIFSDNSKNFGELDSAVLSSAARRRWSDPAQREAQSQRTKDYWQRIKNSRM